MHEMINNDMAIEYHHVLNEAIEKIFEILFISGLFKLK